MKQISLEEFKRIYGCKCEDMQYVYKFSYNGKRLYYHQCLMCGRYREITDLGELHDIQGVSKLFNFELIKAYKDKLQSMYEEYSNRSKSDWRQVYNEYIKTPKWREKRTIILMRDYNTCQGCGQNATEVHHLDYAHLGEELNFELIAVCKTCHLRLHKEKENARNSEHKCDQQRHSTGNM